jgi:hypothetical protein
MTAALMLGIRIIFLVSQLIYPSSVKLLGGRFNEGVRNGCSGKITTREEPRYLVHLLIVSLVGGYFLFPSIMTQSLGTRRRVVVYLSTRWWKTLHCHRCMD